MKQILPTHFFFTVMYIKSVQVYFQLQNELFNNFVLYQKQTVSLVTSTFFIFTLTNCRRNNHQKNVILLDFTRSWMTWVNFHHLLLQTVVFNKVEFLFFPGKFRDAAMRKMTSRDNTNSTKGKAKFQVSTNIYYMEMNNHDEQNKRHSKI